MKQWGGVRCLMIASAGGPGAQSDPDRWGNVGEALEQLGRWRGKRAKGEWQEERKGMLGQEGRLR